MPTRITAKGSTPYLAVFIAPLYLHIMVAKDRITPILAISEGCRVMPPMLIQRLEPWEAVPITGTSIKSPMAIISTHMDQRL